MAVKPIIFSGEMVRAILAGHKTQTRRVVKPQPKVIHAIYPDASLETERIFRAGDQRIHCPYGQPGDRLWVRETWCKTDRDGTMLYRADGFPFKSLDRIWKPSIHMPRWASRLTLEITDVRVQRVQEISEEDVRAEGTMIVDGGLAPIEAFIQLWDSINEKRHPWIGNPWVWAITFRRVEANR